MGILDKITGRTKKAAGDLTGNRGLRSQGAREERKAEAKEQAEDAERRASEKRQEAADLNRRT
jgi:uncharacterized protein YjbJ (UPF0337 family)